MGTLVEKIKTFSAVSFLAFKGLSCNSASHTQLPWLMTLVSSLTVTL